jgi:hypothetical protein
MSHRIYNGTGLQEAAKLYSSVTPPLDARVVGVNYALSQETRAKNLYDLYLARLKSSYQGTLSLDGTENHYDGAYYLLYSLAAAAANMSLPTGADIYTGLKTRIISESMSAVSIDVGFDALSGAGTGAGTLSKLFTDRVNYKISLYGTMGSPDFDRFSGTRISATSAWCLTQATATTWNYAPDGLLFNAATLAYSPPSTGAPTCVAAYCAKLSTGTPAVCQ